MARVGPIGRNVQRLREERVWSQSELARRSGVSQTYISRLEIGERQDGMSGVIRALATALEVSVEELESADDGWEEIDPVEDTGRTPRPRRVVFYADRNVDPGLVDALNEHGITTLSALNDLSDTADDKTVREKARDLGRVLLTLDQGFWDDRRHPLNDTAGIVIIAASPEHSLRVAERLAWFWRVYAAATDIRTWKSMKVRVHHERFRVKFRCPTCGSIHERELKMENGKAMKREIR